jgi:hypothetical protein
MTAIRPSLIKYTLIGCFIFFQSHLCYSQNPEYRAMDLVGNPQSEIATQLGQPVSCKETNQGTSCKYKSKSIEIIYINGRADWLAFGKIKDLPFDFNALSYVGLVPTTPFVYRAGQMHWQNHHGLELISIYGNATHTKVIQIKAFTLE